MASSRECWGDGRDSDDEESSDGDKTRDADPIHRGGGVADLHQCGRRDESDRAVDECSGEERCADVDDGLESCAERRGSEGSATSFDERVVSVAGASGHEDHRCRAERGDQKCGADDGEDRRMVDGHVLGSAAFERSSGGHEQRVQAAGKGDADHERGDRCGALREAVPASCAGEEPGR